MGAGDGVGVGTGEGLAVDAMVGEAVGGIALAADPLEGTAGLAVGALLEQAITTAHIRIVASRDAAMTVGRMVCDSTRESRGPTVGGRASSGCGAGRG